MTQREPGSFGFDFSFRPSDTARKKRTETFRILVIADLSGRAQRGVEKPGDLAARPMRRIDVDEKIELPM